MNDNDAAIFAGQLRAACYADRRPGAPLRERIAAQVRIETILEEAERAGIDLYAEWLVIDEAVRLDLYPAR